MASVPILEANGIMLVLRNQYPENVMQGYELRSRDCKLIINSYSVPLAMFAQARILSCSRIGEHFM